MRPVGDHFSAQARGYAEFRPTYPAQLAAYLASLAPARSLAWDAGTGSGQVAVLLAEYFDRVVATDPSEAQLESAQRHPRVEYHVGREAQVDLPDACCDLVTAAQAAHWFDMARFAVEVRRVLKPGGAVAVWCYARTIVDGPSGQALTDLLRWFQHERVGPYWPAGRALVDDEYRSLTFPFARSETPVFSIERRWNRASLLGYVGTWSAVARCRIVEGGDPVAEFAARLALIWPDESALRRVWSPVHLLVGRVDPALHHPHVQ